MKNYDLQRQLREQKTRNAVAASVLSLVLTAAHSDVLRKFRYMTGLLTKKDRRDLYQKRRQLFNLQRGHGHPAYLSPARRAGLERN